MLQLLSVKFCAGHSSGSKRFFFVHAGVQDTDDFYALRVFPIIDDIVLKLADRQETHSFKLWPFGLVQGAHTRRGEKRLKGFFSGLINAVGCALIIPCYIEPNVNEIVLCRWSYKNREHLNSLFLFE